MTELAKQPDAIEGERYGWLTPEALFRVRGVLLAITLFVGMAVYVFHTLTPVSPRAGAFVTRLQRIGAVMWLYAVVQMLDLRFYKSRFIRRRSEAVGIPDSLHGFLFAQMVAWYGILYYGFTADLRPFIAGLLVVGLAFRFFPIRRN